MTPAQPRNHESGVWNLLRHDLREGCLAAQASAQLQGELQRAARAAEATEFEARGRRLQRSRTDNQVRERPSRKGLRIDSDCSRERRSRLQIRHSCREALSSWRLAIPTRRPSLALVLRG